jgi:hypothetical protein|tara:strand:- start:672 stop:1094 length:423 start_codon:yes stop_codon:yes gene_type:complete
MKKLVLFWWNSIGYWRWPNIGLILVTIYLSLKNLGVLTISSGGWTYHGHRILSETEIEFDTRGDIRSGTSIDARIWSSTAGVYLISADLQGNVSFSLELDKDEEKEFKLPVPSQIHEPLIVSVRDIKENTVSWNLGKLYK